MTDCSIACDFSVDLIHGVDRITVSRRVFLPFFPRVGDRIWVLGLGDRVVESSIFCEQKEIQYSYAVIRFKETDMTPWHSWQEIYDRWMTKFGWSIDEENSEFNPFD